MRVTGVRPPATDRRGDARLCGSGGARTLTVVEPSQGAGLGVQLLGGFAVWVAGEQVPDSSWRLRRAKSVIKLLALAPERRLHREQLVELLWPGEDPAGNSLHQVLYTARRALGPVAGERLTLRDDVVALAGDDVWVDVDAFERAAADARDRRTIEAYRAARERYPGDLLPEDRYEDWTTARRESLRETYLALFVEEAEVQAGDGDGARAIATLQRAVVADPLHEAAHRALMGVFAAEGRRQQALAQYQLLRDALRRELEADPDPETRRLYREILAGQHEEAEPAAQRAAEPLPSGLPRQLTSFIGRERELSELEPIADPALVVEETATALGVQVRSDREPVESIARQIADRSLLLVLDNCEHLVDACARLADRLLRECAKLRVLATSRERLRIHGEVAWRGPPLSLPEREPDPAGLHRSEAGRPFCQRAQ